jgi:uncharacterized protein with von Willebrand factor type A (vWA) domain
MRSIANTGLVVSARAMSCGALKVESPDYRARRAEPKSIGIWNRNARSATGITVQNAFNVSDFALQGFDLLTAKINIADRNLRIGFQPGQKLPEADQVCIDGRLKHTSNDSGLPASEK